MSKQEQQQNIDHHRKIRSYVRREGRFTPAQKSAYESLWPIYGLDATLEQWDFSRVFDRQSDVFLELGFGDGRVLKMLSAQYPENDYLGIEVHRPGVGRVMRELDQQGLKNVRVASEDGVTVALDITITEDLRLEGIARELVNRIQNLRKDSGFEVTDRINISLQKADELELAASRFGDYIKADVLGDRITFAANVDGEELSFDGIESKLSLRKVS